jgi:hypothetical protein
VALRRLPQYEEGEGVGPGRHDFEVRDVVDDLGLQAAATWWRVTTGSRGRGGGSSGKEPIGEAAALDDVGSEKDLRQRVDEWWCSLVLGSTASSRRGECRSADGNFGWDRRSMEAVRAGRLRRGTPVAACEEVAVWGRSSGWWCAPTIGRAAFRRDLPQRRRVRPRWLL